MLQMTPYASWTFMLLLAAVVLGVLWLYVSIPRKGLRLRHPKPEPRRHRNAHLYDWAVHGL